MSPSGQAKIFNAFHWILAGIYFAAHSSTSLGFCGHAGNRHMFLARVLTGRSALSHPNYRRPPQDKRTGRLFDSVSDGRLSSTLGRQQYKSMYGTNNQYGVETVGNASVYVIFDPMQHYPEYLITF